MFRHERPPTTPGPPPASPIATTTASPATLPARTPVAMHQAAPPLGPNLPPTEPVTTVTSGVQVKEYDPVVKEFIHPLETEEIMPIVERERDVAEIHTIIQPIRERVEVDRGIIEKELAVERHEFRDEMS